MGKKGPGKKSLQELTPGALSDREVSFAEYYLLCLNKTHAARYIGCPPAGERAQGVDIYNRPHVKAYIEEKIKERCLTAEETVKLISDTAQGNITDYFVPVMVEYTPIIEVGLQEYINRKNEWCVRELEFIDRAGLQGDDFDRARAGVANVKLEILRLQIELERNHLATRVIEEPRRLKEEMQLDINLLVADKEKGRVKKIKYGKEGLEVEMPSASDAHDKLMKIHGKYAPVKTAATNAAGDDVAPDLSNLSDTELRQYSALQKKITG